MKKILLIIFLIILTASNDSLSYAQTSIQNKEKIFKVNLQHEKKLQESVDKGHQPWRLDPIDVAYKELSVIDKKAAYESCNVLNVKEREATVICDNKSGRKYSIQLKKIVKFKNGIWTVLRIEWDREK